LSTAECIVVMNLSISVVSGPVREPVGFTQQCSAVALEAHMGHLPHLSSRDGRPSSAPKMRRSPHARSKGPADHRGHD
jgi:hypothetical protein